MTLNFPPRPTRGREIDMLLEVLASVIDGRAAVYLSAPVTSGKRFSDWYVRRNGDLDMSRAEHRDEHLREVVEPNRAQARSLVRELRRTFARVLIDPTVVVDLPGWTQDDYRHLWACVVERYVDTVVFVNEWQYSNGCAYEFLTAQRCGVKTLSQDRHSLTLEEGVKLIRSAIAEMHAQALPTTFLGRVVEELTKLRYSPVKEPCVE